MASRKWSLGFSLVGRICKKSDSTSNSTFQVHIPEIIPKIPFGAPKQSHVSINSACFCNAPQCKPAVSSGVYTQNYITVKTLANNGFTNPYFHQSDTVRIDVLNTNIDDLYISNVIDPSHKKAR